MRTITYPEYWKLCIAYLSDLFPEFTITNNERVIILHFNHHTWSIRVDSIDYTNDRTAANSIIQDLYDNLYFLEKLPEPEQNQRVHQKREIIAYLEKKPSEHNISSI